MTSKRVPKKHEQPRLLVIIHGPREGTSARLFLELSRALSRTKAVKSRFVYSRADNVFAKLIDFAICNLRSISDLIWADHVITHVVLVSSAPLLILAKAMGKKITVFQWDVYPSSVGGVPYQNTVKHTLGAKLENAIIRLCTKVVVPSDDFIPFADVSKVAVLPLWPSSDRAELAQRPTEPLEKTVKIVFAGQVNRLRGLDAAIARLSVASEQIELYVATPSSNRSRLQGLSAENVRIFHVGMLDEDGLVTLLSQMHFGLVCLHPDMDQPGFPSKTFDYVSAGLPILYHGPALPSYVRLLEETGVGAVLTTDSAVKLPAIYDSIVEGYGPARAAFFDATALTDVRLDKIL